MMFNWKAMFVGLLLVSLIVAVRLANHYRNNAITYKDQRDTATHKLTLANATITDMMKRQRDVAALDARYTKELADANATIEVSVLMFLLVVSACKSPPPVQSQRPDPAAWAMEKAQDLQQMLNSIITVSEVESTG